jgi:hypothetical protein
MPRQLAMSILEVRGLSLVMWLHTEVDPPADQWEAALAEIVQHRTTRALPGSDSRHLVVSDGAAPNAKQRAQLLRDVWEGEPGKIAVVTTVLSNPIKRGVATAITWINPLSKFYEPKGFRLAVEYLDLGDHIDEVWSAYGELARELPPNSTLPLIAASAGLPWAQPLKASRSS